MFSCKMMIAISAATLFGLAAPAMAQEAQVERTTDGSLTVSWTGAKTVDLYRAAGPDGNIATAKLVSAKDSDGHETLPAPQGQRATFLLRDAATGKIFKAVERVIPLEQGSNFRDIGGYPAAGGKHVVWGKVYRAGATPLLSENDLATINALGLRNMVDLRSDEERQIAPTRIDGVRYNAVGYSMKALMPASGALRNGGTIYRGMPKLLAPQLRLVFDLLKRGDGPLEYNCSAGQDRTGFVTAIVLTALGTPRDVIVKDYLLSTSLRRPEYEMPKINLAAYPDNFAAQMFARMQSDPRASKPQPLMESDGTPFLLSAFDEIEKHWGSVDAYLHQEIGVSAADIAKLRATYTR